MSDPTSIKGTTRIDFATETKYAEELFETGECDSSPVATHDTGRVGNDDAPAIDVRPTGRNVLRGARQQRPARIPESMVVRYLLRGENHAVYVGSESDNSSTIHSR